MLSSLEAEKSWIAVDGSMPSIFRWVSLFFLISLLSAAVGIAGLAGTSLDMARELFFVFMALALVLVSLGLNSPRSVRGRRSASARGALHVHLKRNSY
jgi:uncharacterized membrane protein YtjA (UPF0391 family)